MSNKQRPEALAQFAESARRGERAGVQGLIATEATAPIPTDSKAKDDAATRILAEGATGQDLGSEEAIDRLPDRIQETQGKDNSPIDDGTEASSAEDIAYDATRDPRTGRPSAPLEAQRIARENELERLRLAQTPVEFAEDYTADDEEEEDDDEEVTLEDSVTDDESSTEESADVGDDDLGESAPPRIDIA